MKVQKFRVFFLIGILASLSFSPTLFSADEDPPRKRKASGMLSLVKRKPRPVTREEEDQAGGQQAISITQNRGNLISVNLSNFIAEWEDHFHDSIPTSGYSFKKYVWHTPANVTIGGVRCTGDCILKEEQSRQHYLKDIRDRALRWEHDDAHRVSFPKKDICIRDGSQEIVRKEGYVQRTIGRNHEEKHDYSPDLSSIDISNNKVVIRHTVSFTRPDEQEPYETRNEDSFSAPLQITHKEFKRYADYSRQVVDISFQHGDHYKVVKKQYEIPRDFMHTPRQVGWKHKDSVLQSIPVMQKIFKTVGAKSYNGSEELFVDKEYNGEPVDYTIENRSRKTTGLIFKETTIKIEYKRGDGKIYTTTESE